MKLLRYIITIVILTFFMSFTFGCAENKIPESDKDKIEIQDSRPERLRKATEGWKTNWEKHIIPYDELLSGGPRRDGIASIDEPKFITTELAKTWLAKSEPVIVFDINGTARAYPIQILMWHEIINDIVNNIPIAVTYCPLCNSAIVFDRRLKGSVYEFGTSGLLRNSNLVMYDHTTESLWQQFTGTCIVGELLNEQLTFLPSNIVNFADFHNNYPDGLVLSKETGYFREYGFNPYVEYDNIDNKPFVFKDEIDERLPAMARVVAVSLPPEDFSTQSMSVAYPLSILSKVGVINDVQNGQDLVIFHVPGMNSALDNKVISKGKDIGATGVFDPNINEQKLTFVRTNEKITDKETGSEWNILGYAISGSLSGERLTPIVHGDYFWFVWAEFQPNTSIYEKH